MRYGAITAVLLLLVACSDRRDLGGGHDGGHPFDSGVAADGSGGSGDGAAHDGAASVDFGTLPGCADAARWIYLVTESNAFLRFEPDSAALTTVGTLSCPAGSATPFSMAVDRNATAWVLFNDGNIFDVDVTSVACRVSGFVPNQMGMEVFGMGFVSDAAGSTSETLYIAGGPLAGIGGGTSTLGRIETATLTVSRIGSLTGSPELTGNGAAELWGFFPDARPMNVQQLDKTSAASLRTFDVSRVDSSGLGGAQAWAFAFWGGRYYIFYQGVLDPSSSVWRLTPDTSVVEPVLMNTGFKIVGAGVSTCAPVTLI